MAVVLIYCLVSFQHEYHWSHLDNGLPISVSPPTQIGLLDHIVSCVGLRQVKVKVLLSYYVILLSLTAYWDQGHPRMCHLLRCWQFYQILNLRHRYSINISPTLLTNYISKDIALGGDIWRWKRWQGNDITGCGLHCYGYCGWDKRMCTSSDRWVGCLIAMEKKCSEDKKWCPLEGM